MNSNDDKSNFDEKLQALLAIELNKKIEESKKEPSIVDKLTSHTVSLTAFITALASLGGASLAISTGLKNQFIQDEIKAKQETIVERQNRIDENSRIGNIYYLTEPQMSCEQIPTDEHDRWARYKGCLISISGVQELYSDYDKETRFTCITNHVSCFPSEGKLKQL